jgi:cytochrome c peroxidase
MRTALASLLFVSLAVQPALGAEKPLEGKAALGEKLFSDVSLSKNRTQSCATCHNPEHGFVDNRMTAVGKAVSLGDDGKSLGDRNAPTAAYAKFSPDFHQNKKGGSVGGQFLDGREKDLAGQAGGAANQPGGNGNARQGNGGGAFAGKSGLRQRV